MTNCDGVATTKWTCLERISPACRQYRFYLFTASCEVGDQLIEDETTVSVAALPCDACH